MADESLAEILIRCLNEIDEIGGEERHLLAQTIGRFAYDHLMGKERTANLIDKWLKAGPRSKAAATKALSLAIAREAKTPQLVQRVHRELSDNFGVQEQKRPTAAQIKKHRAAVEQKRNGQRVGYEKPKRVSVTMLAELARNGDASRYIRERRKG